MEPLPPAGDDDHFGDDYWARVVGADALLGIRYEGTLGPPFDAVEGGYDERQDYLGLGDGA